MKSSSIKRGILVAAVLAATGAFAQSQSSAIAQSTPAVMTDVSPLPAEERDSSGAIVLENSMVRAQREAFGGRYTPTQVSSVGRGVDRTLRTARTKEDLRQIRDEEEMRAREMGAGPLTWR